MIILFLFLAVIITALYSVSRILAPEMAQAPTPLKIQKSETQNPVAPKPVTQKPIPPKLAVQKPVIQMPRIAVPKPVENAFTYEPVNRVEKLELLLEEKNKNIKVLQNELTVFLVQVREFDKIKSLLEEEIRRLREQNRIFRSELGIPPIVMSGENPANPENSSNKVQSST